MRLSEFLDRSVYFLSASANTSLATVEQELELIAWELFCDWKQQYGSRFGAGTSSPEIPLSQRQYDGDNHFDYCEVIIR